MYNIVYSIIYRPGCFRTVRGRSEGSWQENRLLYSKYLTLQYILMRSRNRERDLAYVAWKGGAWGIGRRKGCFQLKSRLYIHFSLHVSQNHVYSHRLWRIHQTHVYSHLWWHVHQNHAYSHLLPSQMSSYRASGIPTVCGIFTKIMFIPTFCGMFTKITLIPTVCHHKCPPIGLRARNYQIYFFLNNLFVCAT